MADKNLFEWSSELAGVTMGGQPLSAVGKSITPNESYLPSNWGGIPFMPGYTPGGIPQQQQQGGIFSKIGGTLANPQFQTALSGFSTLANIYSGFKALGLAEDQLDFAKSSFNTNFNAQAQTYNNELKDRWEARTAGAAARGRDYEGMNSWMSGREIQKTGG